MLFFLVVGYLLSVISYQGGKGRSEQMPGIPDRATKQSFLIAPYHPDNR
jgi:hypothetical protein